MGVKRLWLVLASLWLIGSSATIQASCLEVDGNGQEDALTDGLLIIRHLFGFQGESLTADALGNGAIRDAAAITNYLNGLGLILDVDGDGNVDALTDGLLAIRYLFGFSGTALITGAISPGAIRTSSQEIEQYLLECGLPAYISCAEALNNGVTATGVVVLDPDGPGANQPFEAWCEQDFRGGGWLAIYNFMEASDDNAGAAQMWGSINNRDSMESAVLPDSTSSSIYTLNIDMADYTEVVFGWAPSSSDGVSHYGLLTNASGLTGTCYVDQLCGNGDLAGSFDISPTGTTRDVYTGNSPTYPHVGLGFSGQTILWGYDNNATSYSHWANWYDLNGCCAAGNDSSIITAQPWRYVIYVR